MVKQIICVAGILFSILLLLFHGFAFLIISRWKKSLMGYGVELESWQILLITLSDIVLVYWYFSLPVALGIGLLCMSGVSSSHR